jgi:hypothetical protein
LTFFDLAPDDVVFTVAYSVPAAPFSWVSMTMAPRAIETGLRGLLAVRRTGACAPANDAGRHFQKGAEALDRRLALRADN